MCNNARPQKIGQMRRDNSTMAIRIKARSNESAQQMMRRFKKLCEKEGLTKDIKRRAYYEKPSERRQRAARKSVKRVEALASPRRPGPRGG
jgi:small subunit ribosomal protein S21